MCWRVLRTVPWMERERRRKLLVRHCAGRALLLALFAAERRAGLACFDARRLARSSRKISTERANFDFTVPPSTPPFSSYFTATYIAAIPPEIITITVPESTAPFPLHVHRHLDLNLPVNLHVPVH